MRTFQIGDERLGRFWHIERRGRQITTTYGRVGGAGRSHTRDVPHGDAAAEMRRLIAEKLEAGYVETTARARVASPLRDALEAALADNPDDLAAHMAYADHLHEIGDPLGDFVQVQLALEDAGRPAAERRALHKREKELLHKHRDEWAGAVADFLPDETDLHPRVRYRFARGWLDALEIEDHIDAEEAPAIASEPRCRLLRRLVLGYLVSQEYIYEDMDARGWAEDPVAVLARSEYLGNVRQLHLGDEDGFVEKDAEACGYNSVAELYVADDGGAWPLIRKMPRLEELYLHCDTVGLGGLLASSTLANLRVLQVYLSDEYGAFAALAARGAFTRLTHLSLKPRATEADEGAGAYLGLREVRPLLRPGALPALTHLRLQNSDLGDAGCVALVKSGILKRLKFLDLARGTVTDAGAATLAACPDATSLDALDLSRNALTRAGARLLRDAGVKVRADDQHAADDLSFLYEGEME